MSWKTRFKALALGVVLACAGAMALPVGAQQTSAPPATTTTTSSTTTATPAPSAAPVDPIYSYRLGAGDKVRVIVFNETTLSGEFTINGEGKLSLPLIGEINAAGLTATQVQQKIESALLEGYLKDPRVAVEVLTFRPFYIYGEVIKPGEYPYANGMTVDRAVATAGGYTYRADKKRVYIKRATEEQESAIVLKGAVVIQPGDTIRIGERHW